MNPMQLPNNPVCKPVARISTTSKNVAALNIGYIILSPGAIRPVAEEAVQTPSRSAESKIHEILGLCVRRKRTTSMTELVLRGNRQSHLANLKRRIKIEPAPSSDFLNA